MALMEEDSSMVQNVTWTPVADATDGRHVVSVVSRSGCLFNYLVKPERLPNGTSPPPVGVRSGAGGKHSAGAAASRRADAALSWTGVLRGCAHSVAAPFSFVTLLLLLAAALALLLLALSTHLQTSPGTVVHALALMWGSSTGTGVGSM